MNHFCLRGEETKNFITKLGKVVWKYRLQVHLKQSLSATPMPEKEEGEENREIQIPAPLPYHTRTHFS